jgi:aryl-alcohol dehydrogenase-like predicted oxidoreductase
VVPIPGTRQVRWLDENLDAAALAPRPDTLAALDGIFAPGAAAGARYSAAERRRVEL